MDIIKAERPKTWKERLTGLKRGSSMHIDLKACNSVSAKVSQLKSEHPDKSWNWRVEKVKVDGKHHHGKVTRLS